MPVLCCIFSSYSIDTSPMFSSGQKYSQLIVFLIFIVIRQPARAQQNIWQTEVPRTKKHTTAKHTTSRLQQLHDHIKSWGLANDYDRELLAGGRLNSNGWSAGVYFFTRHSAGTYNFWQLHFSEIKQEKQIKQQPGKNSHPELGIATPYVFGKINNLYTLQIGFGQEQLLLPGVIEDNLSVSFRYNAGFSLAMLKPYYLQLVRADYSGPEPAFHLEDIKYSDNSADDFLNNADIHGSSKWSKGLSETQFIPGVYLEAAFVITPKAEKWLVEAITLGANASVYTKTLPVMAELPAKPYQVCLFAGLAIGKRWK
ncbi:MAG: hypothetical protein JST70_13980 [Bacteroidetes bacterium]|nr:hypothetical protein [Bacteroidota bacterium]